MNKIKGITIWEQQAEYIALGVATVALIAFAAMQFIGEPNAVQVAGHGKVTPGNVDQRLTEAAERLDVMLSPEAQPPVQIGDPRPVLPEFERALAAGISPSPTIRTLVAGVPLTPGEAVRVGETFTVPHVPAPTAAVARQFFDTLTDGVVDQHGLTDRFRQRPYDATWITAAAAIDLAAVVESYRDTGPDGDLAPIPTSWHAGLATILDVRVEREELVDGQWAGRKVVNPLPGQVTYREEIRDGVDATGRESLVRAARDLEAQRAIAQPPFYPTRNSVFIPPDPLEPEIEIITAAEDSAARQLQQLRRLERERENLWRQLSELGGPPPGEGPAQPGRGSGSDGGNGGDPTPPGSPPPVPGGGPGVGGGAHPGAGGPAASEGDLQQRRNLMTRITRLDRRIESLRTQLDLGDDRAIDEPVEDEGVFVVWSHDMDIEAGRTYRYRVVVDIYNPFYLRRMNLVEDQQELAEVMVISSPAGDWSEPIQARAPLHPYIVSAYAPGQDRGAVGSTLGHAIAEVFCFHDGRWWHSRFTLEPGQRVGGVREEGGQRIDFGTEWFVLDIIEDNEAEGGATGPGREGRAARVVLQHLHSGEITELRHPEVDLQDPNRQRLMDEIRFADLG